MFNVLRAVGHVSFDKEEENRFFSQNGYSKEFNQRNCGIDQKGLLTLLNELYKQGKTVDKTNFTSFEDFVQKFVLKLTDSQLHVN